MLEAPKLKQGVDGSRVSTESGGSKDVLVVVMDTAHHKLGIDCNVALVIGDPVQDLSNFQMAPIPFLSDLTCSTHSPHDILKV